MARRPRAQNGHRWRELTARLRRNADMCAMPECLCPSGRWIDKSLKGPHPWSFSADHVIPVFQWPEGEYVFDNLRAAHRRCNNVAQPSRKEPSRDW